MKITVKISWIALQAKLNSIDKIFCNSFPLDKKPVFHSFLSSIVDKVTFVTTAIKFINT